jgi:hypothetical protein
MDVRLSSRKTIASSAPKSAPPAPSAITSVCACARSCAWSGMAIAPGSVGSRPKPPSSAPPCGPIYPTQSTRYRQLRNSYTYDWFVRSRTSSGHRLSPSRRLMMLNQLSVWPLESPNGQSGNPTEALAQGVVLSARFRGWAADHRAVVCLSTVLLHSRCSRLSGSRVSLASCQRSVFSVAGSNCIISTQRLETRK